MKLPLSAWLLAATKQQQLLRLQEYHDRPDPASLLHYLAEYCTSQEIDTWDVYGDFDDEKEESSSYLRRFEKEVADTLNKQDAVFMPSGVMSQSIALLIHDNNRYGRFACHQSCHLLLHEEHGYRELVGLEAVVLETPTLVSTDDDDKKFPRTGPLDAATVAGKLDNVSTLLLELPHRELGGKLTPWNDVLLMWDHCRQTQTAFHCDGARLFEAAAGYNKSLAQVAEPFDSVYISFYKGLAGLSGSMLVGSTEFCASARVWLQRFGGNLYTLLPYVVAAQAGFDRYWRLTPDKNGTVALSFAEKCHKLQRLVALLQTDPMVSQIASFEPRVPDTNMVHICMKASKEMCTQAVETTKSEIGICTLHRIRSIEPVGSLGIGDKELFSSGYRARSELTLGESNGRIPDDDFLKGWRSFAAHLLNTTVT